MSNMKILKYLKNPIYWRALFPTIIFNLRFLPFNQAVKLPIWVYKMRLLSRKGSISIKCDHLRTGMIKLGFPRSAVYPNNGITWKNEGEVIFKGSCRIGNDCYIVVGKQGRLTIGHDFRVTAGLKMISQCRISFGNHVLIGWDVKIIDSNFHPIYDINNKKFKKAYSPIVIGDNNWFSTQCFIMHGVHTPDNCIFGARSILTRGGQYESYCVHGGSPIRILSRKVMRDFDNDLIKEYTIPQE